MNDPDWIDGNKDDPGEIREEIASIDNAYYLSDCPDDMDFDGWLKDVGIKDYYEGLQDTLEALMHTDS